MHVQMMRGDGADATAARIGRAVAMINRNGSNVSIVSNVSASAGSGNGSNSNGSSAGSTAAISCEPFDNDACLLASPFWNSGAHRTHWTCANSVSYCAVWAKDMQRCCSLACGTVYLTQDSCNHNGNLGTCVYPHLR